MAKVSLIKNNYKITVDPGSFRKPMKPEIKFKHGGRQNMCPRCATLLCNLPNKQWHKYCHECGQAIDWSRESNG